MANDFDRQSIWCWSFGRRPILNYFSFYLIIIIIYNYRFSAARKEQKNIKKQTFEHLCISFDDQMDENEARQSMFYYLIILYIDQKHSLNSIFTTVRYIKMQTSLQTNKWYLCLRSPFMFRVFFFLLIIVFDVKTHIAPVNIA